MFAYETAYTGNLGGLNQVNLSIGDETDRALCMGISHEFLRCRQAYIDFLSAAAKLPQDNTDRFLAFRTHDTYSRFLFHLFEFSLGALRRDLKRIDFPNKRSKNEPDDFIQGHAERILFNAKDDQWPLEIGGIEFRVSNLPEYVSPSFAKDWRIFRNNLNGHVDHARAKLDLTSFYRTHHIVMFLFLWKRTLGGEGWGQNFQTWVK